MSAAGAAEVLVLEPPVGPSEVEAILGQAGATLLQAQLRGQATALAARLAPAGFHKGVDHLCEAVARVFAATARPGNRVGPGRPLLVIWPLLARLSERHAAAALDDLRSGVDVVIGPVIDGGLYMLGFGRPLPDLLERLDGAPEGADLATSALAAASEMGLEVGLLRVERPLRTSSDLAAALADPLTPGPIREMLIPRNCA